MKKTLRSLGLCSILSLGIAESEAKVMTREQVIAEAETMAITQFDAMNWNFWARFWMDGVFWVGVADLTKVSEEKKLWEALNKLGNREVRVKKGDDVTIYGKWTLLYESKEKEPHHADDMPIGEAFLAVYEKSTDPVMIEDTRRRVGEASTSILSPEKAKKATRAADLHWQEGLTWYWCDALFMAAPLHARLSAVTGDSKYLKAMHTEWKRASDLLYDPEEHLYFRDKNFLTRQSKNGKKVFWSRGNGWVMGAFARTIPHIPKDDPQRPWYINQFKEMAAKLASLQRADGTWSPSLLDFEHFPHSESSGTALNCLAFAWGINSGILEDKTYRPVVEKAWAALLAAKTDKGFIGYVQGVGAEPSRVRANQIAWYGNGAFLSAATEVAGMAPINIPSLPPLNAMPPAETAR